MWESLWDLETENPQTESEGLLKKQTVVEDRGCCFLMFGDSKHSTIVLNGKLSIRTVSEEIIMSSNKKSTSAKVAEHAAKTLQDSNASKVAKSLAGSALSQSGNNKQTGGAMEEKASKVLKSPKYSKSTKSLAASVLSQSNKSR